MPNLAQFHPQVVHFAIALLLVGVAFRIVSLSGRLRFTNHAALAMLLIGTAAAVLSVKSGDDAHGPVERIPGARAVVVEHEQYGEKTRNIFLAVVALELVAVALSAGSSTRKYTRWVHGASAVVGIWGAVILYETAEHGGELVYSYAGGPGSRTGDPADAGRVLLSGLYQQAAVDRKAGRKEDAARLTDEMARRFGGDTTVQFLNVESLLFDRADPPRALAALDAVALDATNARWQTRKAMLRADIFLAMSQPDSARAVLQAAAAAFPANTRVKAKLDSIGQ